jgi:hypothetical protein
VITSDQPLTVIVAEATPFGGSASAVSAGAAATLNTPFAFNKAFGGYTTQLAIFNAGASATNATVTFYDGASGLPVAAATRTLNIGAKQSYTLDQALASSNLPAGFDGWAQIVGPNGSTLVAQVLEQNATIRYVSLVNAAIGNGSSKVYAPAIFNLAYGSFVTGADIVNPNSTPVTVSVTYYSNSGIVLNTTPFQLAAKAVANIYSAGPGIPGTGLPIGFAGAASVTAQGGGVFMTVNEFGGYTSAGTTESGTYSAVSSGGNNVGLPVMANDGYGYTTGATILNISDQAVSGSVQYYKTDGSMQGGPQAFTVGAHASQAIYQGGSGRLPSGFYGSAIVSQRSGPDNSLIVTTNAIAAAFFYTYTEPNN